MPRQTGSARVRLQAIQHEREIVFSIAGNGVGFDRQYARKLFGAFQRLHRPAAASYWWSLKARASAFNVRRILVRHGGRTWAEGKAGQEATFFLSLPVPSAKEKS